MQRSSVHWVTTGHQRPAEKSLRHHLSESIGILRAVLCFIPPAKTTLAEERESEGRERKREREREFYRLPETERIFQDHPDDEPESCVLGSRCCQTTPHKLYRSRGVGDPKGAESTTVRCKEPALDIRGDALQSWKSMEPSPLASTACQHRNPSRPRSPKFSCLKRENETRDCSTAFRQSSQRGWHKKCIDTEPSKRPSPAQGLLAGMVLIYPRLFAGSWITQPWQAVATPSFRSTCRAPSGNPSSPSSKASSTYRCWQHEYHMCRRVE